MEYKLHNDFSEINAQEWNDLLKDSVSDTPFLRHEYQRSWWEHRGGGVHIITRPEGVDTLRRNLAFHQLLTRGFDIKIEQPDGRVEYRHIYPLNWEEPDKNEFWAVNQLPVHGQNDRRPDIVIFVNGLPLVVFELKNPYSEKPTVEEAYNQIQHYTHDISQLFDFNAFVVVSDGITTHHGVWIGGHRMVQSVEIYRRV